MIDKQGPQKRIFESDKVQDIYMKLTHDYQETGLSFNEAKALAFAVVLEGGQPKLADYK